MSMAVMRSSLAGMSVPSSSSKSRLAVVSSMAAMRAYGFPWRHRRCRSLRRWPARGLIVLVGQRTGEVDVAARQLGGPLLGVDVLELHQGHTIAAEAVLLNEEGHEDAVDLEHQVVGIDAVEHVVVEEERHFALHAVGLAQPAYLVDFLLYQLSS